jgi:hypothetical protein
VLGDDDDFDDDIKWLGDDDGRTAVAGIALQLNGHVQGKVSNIGCFILLSMKCCSRV